MRNDWIQPVAALFVVGIAVSSSWGREAATDANGLATLQDYLRYAALHNPGLQAAFEEWKAALQQVPQARALPDPRFTYGYFIEEVETRVGPQRQRVNVTQVFPWFGTIEARTDAAAAAAKAAQKRYEAKKLRLFHDVKDAFFEYLYLQRAIEIARDDLVLIRHFEEVVRRKYVTATAGHPDIIRAQVEMAILDDQLKALEELRTPIVAQLNAVLNRSDDSLLPWPKQTLASPADVDRATLFDALRRQNPELQAMDFDIESARSRIELAKMRFYPDLGIGVDWVDTRDAAMGGIADSGKDPVVLMFSMNLPIWRKSYGASELQARAAVRRVAHQKQDMENSLIAKAEQVLYDYEDNGRKINLYGTVLVPKAEELVGASETAYSSGTIDFLNLINARQTLLRFRLQYERALTDRNRKLAELEALAGRQLTDGRLGTR
jgi:outer membrane protein TolC